MGKVRREARGTRKKPEGRLGGPGRSQRTSQKGLPGGCQGTPREVPRGFSGAPKGLLNAFYRPFESSLRPLKGFLKTSEPGEKPECRPGGPGDLKRARNYPHSSFKIH